MLLVPKDYIEIDTEKNQEEVMDILRSQTQVQAQLSTSDIRKLTGVNSFFIGEVGYSDFKITRVIYGNNVFRPILKGIVEKKEKGCKISVKLGLATTTVIGLLLSLVLALYLGIKPMFAEVPSSSIIDSIYLWIGLIIASYLYVLIMYKIDLGKAKKKIYEMFSDKPEQEE